MRKKDWVLLGMVATVGTAFVKWHGIEDPRWKKIAKGFSLLGLVAAAGALLAELE